MTTKCPFLGGRAYGPVQTGSTSIECTIIEASSPCSGVDVVIEEPGTMGMVPRSVSPAIWGV
ncbi:hypothetical protein ACFOLD_08245 [Kocuria carniphila]|uniref:hypothetical protein n=1 Tax=Kocuria carniphila TaxID=262208 RepID=UPI00360BE8EF